MQMAGLPTGDTYVQSAFETGSFSHDKPEEDGGRWYFSRKEIEENSPSRRDGIDLKKESYLRKSYCTFLQDLGMRLKVPQVTIATAIIFCHRFFLRQSHSKNDRRNIATVCMFLAGKVEETPRPLKDVIITSYDIVHKKDSEAVQSRIKQKDVYEQQKELILLGERVVLATLGFDLNVLHPYKPLVEAIKKFKVAQNALAQVAWNFVNDGLRTSLCLQFKPHHIAAGAIFLAAKFLKVKLPSDGERVWWQEFDVTPRQLEEVSNQMLELYEQNRILPSQASEAEGSAGTPRPPARAPAASEDNVSALKVVSSKLASRTMSDQVHPDNHVGSAQAAQVHDYETSEAYSHEDHKGDGELSEHEHHEEEAPRASRYGSEGPNDEYQERSDGRTESWDAGEVKEKSLGAAGESPQQGPKLDKNKLKAQIEKRRKSRPDVSRKSDVMDDDDLIERELEDGIELAAEDEKIKIERVEHADPHHNFDNVDFPVKKEHGEGDFPVKKEHENFDNVEEGELEPFDIADQGYQSRKRKPEDSPDKLADGKQQRLEYTGSHNHHDFSEDRSRLGYSDRDHKRHVQENHV